MKRLLILLLTLGLSAPAFAEDTKAPAKKAPEKTKLLILDLKTTAVDDDTALLVAGLMAVKLSQYEALEVFSGADVKRMMELEADKLATGCEDDSSCIADIAGALGTRYVIYGRLGKLGSRYITTLNLFDADEGKAVKRMDIKAADLDQLGDELEATLDQLVSSLVRGEQIAKADSSTSTNDTASEPPPNTPPPAQDNEAALALRVGLIAGGGGVAVLSYLAAAAFAASFEPIDDFAFVNYVPILGPVLYSFSPTPDGFEPICYTCAAFQAVGVAAAIAGLFVNAGGDKKPDSSLRVELPAPRRFAAAPPSAAMAF